MDSQLTDSVSENLFPDIERSGARFSEDGKYRYLLWRVWDESKPCIMFIGLNPSTATAAMDDPTIRRVKGFAKSWGYGGVYMANLFAFISPYPKDLLTVADPIKDNDIWLKSTALNCKDILFAWGSFPEAEKRAAEVIEMFPNAVCLGLNKNGTPKHPLYIKANQQQINFK
jgi:hypothetical protein